MTRPTITGCLCPGAIPSVYGGWGTGVFSSIATTFQQSFATLPPSSVPGQIALWIANLTAGGTPSMPSPWVQQGSILSPTGLSRLTLFTRATPASAFFDALAGISYAASNPAWDVHAVPLTIGGPVGYTQDSGTGAWAGDGSPTDGCFQISDFWSAFSPGTVGIVVMTEGDTGGVLGEGSASDDNWLDDIGSGSQSGDLVGSPQVWTTWLSGDFNAATPLGAPNVVQVADAVTTSVPYAWSGIVYRGNFV
jgi:hypothetical protein